MNQKAKIGERLSEERKRGGLSQAAFAAIGGVTVKTQVLYEKSERVPDASYLAAIAESNFDVLYILVGERATSALTVEEAALVGAYRQLDERGRTGVLALLSGIQPEPRRRVRVKGDVGQYVEGDVTVSDHLTIDMRKTKKRS